MSADEAVLATIIGDHRPFGDTADLATCRCNGVEYETADWAKHVARAYMNEAADA